MLPTERSSMLLPTIIQENALRDPSGVFACIPNGTKTDYKEGYKDITKLQFHNAVNYTASLINERFGPAKDFETLTYLGPADIRYSMMVVAGMKIGYKVFLPSPRNSTEAHIALLTKLQCSKLVMTEPPAPSALTIVQKYPLQTLSLPSLGSLLEVQNVAELAYNKTTAKAQNDPVFVLHTSGSTGIPKPLTFTNDFISRLVKACSLPAPKGYVDINQYFATGKFFMTLPSFHIAGLAYSLLIAAYYGSVPVYPVPGPPPTTEALIAAISNTAVDWAFVPPVVIDTFAKRSDLLDIAQSRLKYLFFTGGSVPRASGDVVAQRLPIWQVLGSSECASLPLVHPKCDYQNTKEWSYVQLNPLLKTEMRGRLDDLYELVVVRHAETESFQPVFAHFPDTAEYPTRDLFKPHPSKPDLWVYQGRMDDIIVFLNGEKTNPVTFEEQVASHPEVKAALVFGAQRVEAGLLVEVKNNASLSVEERAETIDRIWPIVEKANKATPAHARVLKSRILLVKAEAPMLRAGKGTVQRAATLTLYAEDIEKSYQEESSPDNVPEQTQRAGVLPDRNDIKMQVRELVAEMLGFDDLDFFQMGMDSLGVLQLQRALKTRFPDLNVTADSIYSSPSVRGIVQTLNRAPTNEEPNEQDLTRHLTEMLKNFSQKVDTVVSIDPLALPVMGKIKVVLLTGSTGALGSFILDRLLSRDDVAHIYCLNRTADAKERQIKNSSIRKLTARFPSDRVTFLCGALAEQSLGLPTDVYETLLSRVTHIVHNAWPVNFNLPLQAFEPSLLGIISLIQLLARSKFQSSIQFLSSISSVSSYPAPVVPEAVIGDPSAPATMGYGQAKYIAERLLDYASKRLGIHVSLVRIGQVAGAARTASGWNKQEWLPSLVVSSALIKALPETLGDDSADRECVNWVPIDHLADVVVQLAVDVQTGQEGFDGETPVFQVVHPSPIPWSSVLSTTKKILEDVSDSPASIKIVPYDEWISAVKAADDGPAVTLAHRNPALKLLSFYESLRLQGIGGLRKSMAMEKTLHASRVLKGLEPLKDEWVGGWVREWVGAVTCSPVVGSDKLANNK